MNTFILFVFKNFLSLTILSFLSISLSAQTLPVIVSDINVGAGSSFPADLIEYNGYLYFSASDGTNGRELWRSDGVITSLVADLNSGPGSSNPKEFTIFNNELYFIANPGATFGSGELWKVNSTGNTQLIKDFAAIGGYVSLKNSTVLNNEMFFEGSDAIQGRELWKTGGTTSTTVLVVELDAGISSGLCGRPMFTVNNKVIFCGDTDIYNEELHSSDGSVGNGPLIYDLNPGSSGISYDAPHLYNGKIYFHGKVDGFGVELGIYDPNASPPVFILDLNPGSPSTSPINTRSLNGRVYFSGNTPGGREFWYHNENSNTATIVPVDPAINSSPSQLFAYGDEMMFAADELAGRALWSFNSINDVLTNVSNLNPDYTFSSSWFFRTICNDDLFFSGQSITKGEEIWKYDGNTLVQVGDINPGIANSSISYLTTFNNAIYFSANDGTNGAELWKLDCGSLPQPPTAICQDTVVLLDFFGNVSITASHIDNGSTAPAGIQSIAVSPNTFDCSNVGPNNVTLTITDINGDQDTCHATVTVIDNSPPTADCNNIGVQYLDSIGETSISIMDISGISTGDFCGISSILLSDSLFDCSDIGTNSVSMTVIDVNGNSASCSTMFDIADNLPPILSCQDITLSLDSNGNANLSLNDILISAFDNCTPDTILNYNVSQTAFTIADSGMNTVTISATDQFGNTGICNSIVTIIEDVPCVCSGNKLSALTFVYNGPAGGSLSFYNDKKGSANKLIQTFTNLQPGIPVILNAPGKFKNVISFTDSNGNLTLMDASCNNNPIGNTYGISPETITITGYEDDKGNVCPIMRIANFDALGGISVYPNPTSGSIILKFNTNSNELYNFRLMNDMGQVVQSYSKIYSDATMVSEELDLSNYRPGIYILVITNSKDRISKRIVLQK